MRIINIFLVILLMQLGNMAFAGDVKLGILLGFTGPVESLTPAMAQGAELAIKEVNDSGALLGGMKVDSVRGDTTCIDSAAAVATTERIVTVERVDAIIGGDCSGVTIAMLQNVAKPNGIVMVSPSATSPALSTIEDNGLFFRTAPSDARQGEVIADILHEMNIKKAALTYTNNDYGKGLADSITTNMNKRGGQITISIPHEDGKGDYSSEVATLAAVGGEILIVAGYLDQGGKGIIQASIDSGAFDWFFLPDGMMGNSLIDAIGHNLNGSIGTFPGTDSPGAAKLAQMLEAAGRQPFVGESYDAAALILLAMQSARSTDSYLFKDHIIEVANAPGEKIYPGELEKALRILEAGGEIDYVGASAVELIGPGENAGHYQQMLVKDSELTIVGYR